MQGWDNGLVAVHIPEFLFGMTFLTLKDQIKAILEPVLVLGLINLPVDEKVALLHVQCADFLSA